MRKNRLANMCLLFVLVLTPTTLAAAPPSTQPSATRAALADIQKTFGFVPEFFREVSELALPSAWELMKTLQMNPETALPGKIKELIGLAVAAQVPCRYCVHAHTAFARLHGATNEEIAEAVALGATARHWSTWVNGVQTNEAEFRLAVDRALETARKANEENAKLAAVDVTDAASAKVDIASAWGSLPSFIESYPPEALAGAWKTMRDVEMNPGSAIPDMYKSLITLAVSSQIPCKYCVYADTEFARLGGASDREINEAVAMAAITRYWSTQLNGLDIDDTAFRRDIARVVRGVKAKQADEKKGIKVLRRQ